MSCRHQQAKVTLLRPHSPVAREVGIHITQELVLGGHYGDAAVVLAVVVVPGTCRPQFTCNPPAFQTAPITVDFASSTRDQCCTSCMQVGA
jgi:hypothetical protein